MDSKQWNAGTKEQKFEWLRAISFSKHDAGIMCFHNWDFLPRYVRAQLETFTQPTAAISTKTKTPKLKAGRKSEERLPNSIDELQARLRIALEDHPNDERVFQIVSEAIQKIDALIAEKSQR